MLDGAQQKKFGDDKRDTLPGFCKDCNHLKCAGAVAPRIGSL